MDNANLIIIIAIILFFVLKRLGLVSPQKAAELLKNGAKIIDVRSPGEFNQSSLDEAINIPVDEIKQKVEKIIPDKETPLLIFCLTGTRSAIAKSIFKSAGYKNVHNLGSYGRANKILNQIHKE
ncbi:MAG: rhodanese-like domain-containing protein [Candidatus Rifleibacteriota bacterium]